MARKRKGRPINGILLVDKPQELSSNDVVQKIKRLFKAAKAGHTGALDPLATGLLPVCLGEATKFSQFLLDADKSYFVTAKLGERTDTSDADGEIVETRPVLVEETDIKAALLPFLGAIKQVPSMFSALKHEGKPLYFYARKGIEIDRPARDITIYNIEWVGLDNNQLSLNVKCSKGTYIRSLIDDLGQALGCGAHVTVLRRTQVAHYDSAQMFNFAQLIERAEQTPQQLSPLEAQSAFAQFGALDTLLLPMDTSIASLPKIEIAPTDVVLFQQGRILTTECNDSLTTDSKGELCTVRVYDKKSELFLGVAQRNSIGELHPKRVVVYES